MVVAKFFLSSKRVVRFLLGHSNIVDAADTGTASYEFGASLFLSKILASKGPRTTLQKCLQSPSVALTFNLLVSINIIAMNKLVLGKIGFNYPILLTIIHYSLSCVFMAILKAFSHFPPSPAAKPIPLFYFVALGITIALACGVTNVSLKYDSNSIVSVWVGQANCDSTPATMLLEFLLFGKKTSYLKPWPSPYCLWGFTVATDTSLHFNLFGTCIALVCVLPSALSSIICSNLQCQYNWSALGVMWKTTPITVVSLLALMPWLDPPGALAFRWSFASISAVLTSGVLRFLVRWSIVLALGRISATSHVVFKLCKTCVVLFGGYLVSDSSVISGSNICGAAVAFCGMLFYTYLSLRSAPQISKAAPSEEVKRR